MKVFCLLARREIAANRKAFFWIAVTMAASFLLGETISLCVTAGSGQVEYGSMGAIFAGIFGVIVACVMIGMQFSQGFGFAVKMGVSRRRYLAGAFAAAFALMIFALAGTALLQGLDWLVVKLAMPELRYAFHLLTALPWYATIGAVLGICITGVALSAAAGAFLLRFGKPFIMGCLGGACGALFASISSLGATGTGVTGIFGILLCLNNPVSYILMFVIAFGVAFVLTWMFGYKDEVQETAGKNIETEKKAGAPAENAEMKSAEKKTAESGVQTLYSPLEGTAIPLSEVKDATFASEVLGRGMAVIPSKGEVKAPCDATVSTIFDTKHAIGLATESGLELLIHIGVDTVELGGKFYTAHVKDGDVVKKGQTLITFDMDAIKAAGYDVTTPLIVTNTDDYEEVKMLAEGTVNNGSEVLEVK